MKKSCTYDMYHSNLSSRCIHIQVHEVSRNKSIVKLAIVPASMTWKTLDHIMREISPDLRSTHALTCPIPLRLALTTIRMLNRALRDQTSSDEQPGIIVPTDELDVLLTILDIILWQHENVRAPLMVGNVIPQDEMDRVCRDVMNGMVDPRLIRIGEAFAHICRQRAAVTSLLVAVL